MRILKPLVSIAAGVMLAGCTLLDAGVSRIEAHDKNMEVLKQKDIGKYVELKTREDFFIRWFYELFK